MCTGCADGRLWPYVCVKQTHWSNECNWQSSKFTWLGSCKRVRCAWGLDILSRAIISMPIIKYYDSILRYVELDFIILLRFLGRQRADIQPAPVYIKKWESEERIGQSTPDETHHFHCGPWHYFAGTLWLTALFVGAVLHKCLRDFMYSTVPVNSISARTNSPAKYVVTLVTSFSSYTNKFMWNTWRVHSTS